MTNLIKEISKRLFKNSYSTRMVEADEKQKEVSFNKLSQEDLKNIRWPLGYIYLGGLAKNNEKRKIKDTSQVTDCIEKYVLLCSIPRTDWFIDIESGEYYKRANVNVGYNIKHSICYDKNDFKHDNYYVYETLNLYMNSVFKNHFADKKTTEEVKQIYKRYGLRFNAGEKIENFLSQL